MIKRYIKWFVGRCLTPTAILFFFAVPAVAKPMLSIQHWVNKNKVPVYFVPETQLPMLDIAVVFNAGSIYDGKEYGLASLTASMLNEGAGKYNTEQLAEQFDDVGAQFSAGIDKGTAVISLRTLTKSEALKSALNTFHLVLTRTTFPKDSLARLKKQTLVAIQAQQQSAPAMAGKTFLNVLYGSNPYGHLAIGEADTVKSIDQKDLVRFYQQYYVANNAFIVMVGHLSADQAKNISNKLTANMREGKKAVLSMKKVGMHSAQLTNISLSLPQTAIALGNLGVARNNTHYFSLMLGNYILGGGMSSRLFKQVREQDGLSYNVGSGFITWKSPGPFLINLQTKNQNVKQAVVATQKVLSGYVASGPTAKELQAAKQYFTNSLAMQFSSNASVLGAVVDLVYYGLPLNYYDTLASKIDAVTASQIKQAFQQYVNPKKLIIVTAGGKL